MQQLNVSQDLWRQMAAMVCLTAFLLGGASAFPGIAALIARLDGGHEVRVVVADREVQVVLHHASGCDGSPPWSAPHRHRVACALLCAVWADSAQTADHVLGFRTVSVSELPAGKPIPSDSSAPGAIHAAGLIIGPLNLGEGADLAAQSVPNSPPRPRVPLESAAVGSLRSVVLLI